MNKPTPKKLRVGMLGRTQWLADACRKIHAQGHSIDLLWTAKDESFYRFGLDQFEQLAQAVNAHFFVGTKSTAEVEAWLKQNPLDVGISVNWPILLTESLLERFNYGVLNAHAGDLPRYRGNACPNWAILHGEPQIACTIHRMVPELDAGPILLKQFLPMHDDLYIEDVYAWLSQTIPNMFSQATDLLARGEAVFKAQSTDPTHALRCYPRRAEDGQIQWAQSADQILRLIRASSKPFDGAFTTLENQQKVVIWRAEKVELPEPALVVPGQVCLVQQGDPVVACGQGALRLRVLSSPDHTSIKQCITSSLRNRLI
ncbi:methionyl-tRNA formyltransferase [Magnetococcus sp. PR-3]|uniref:methionyl-tRNA formyltransferase n=1 Tax=Magnetococcus sp. PR-3 TaxID=3120355 RepID=UPI002FCDF2C2